MSNATQRKAIEFIKRTACKTGPLNISFYGGEALLEQEIIKMFVGELTAFFGSRVEFDISTNGYLLGKHVVDYVCSHPQIHVSVTVDGCKDIHDRNRRHADGSATFDKIASNLNDFKVRYPKEYDERIKLLVTLGSYSDIAIANKEYDKLKDMCGKRGLKVSRIVQNYDTGNYLIESQSERDAFVVEAMKHKANGITDLYTIVLDELLRCGKKRRTLPVWYTVGSKDKLETELHTCLNNPYCVFISSDGDLFPCEKFGTAGAIGNLDTGFNEEEIKKVAMRYALRRTLLCHSCAAYEYCKLCLKDSKMKFGDQRKFCKDYIENIKTAIKIIENGKIL